MVERPAVTDTSNSSPNTEEAYEWPSHEDIPSFCVVIPAYQPNMTLYELITKLQTDAADQGLPLTRVIVVNDGSTATESKEVFSQLKKLHDVLVLSHDRNNGKGAALKTAFRYIQNNPLDDELVTTADADGQHLPEDILRVSTICAVEGAPGLGVREFSADVPLRSRFGNLATIGAFKLFSGVKIQDTQTGLRTYLIEQINNLLEIQSDGYAFEFDALFSLVSQWGSELKQIPITTVYEPGNPASHFRPIADSALIYLVFLRYTSISVLISIIEGIIFSAISLVVTKTFIALVLARALTLPGYFAGMKTFTFRAKGNTLIQFGEVLLLVAANLVFLTFGIKLLHSEIGIPKVISFWFSSIIFFLLNFLIQRYIIFRS